jgi:hypothetical protein
MKIILFCSICLLAIAGWTFDAASQPVNAATIEGHVYDRNTLRPLSKIIIILIYYLKDSGATLSSAATTDSNGFYSLDGGQLDGVSSQIVAECTLRRGIASSTISMYAVLQPRIYRRDIYMSLSRTDAGCRAASR